MTGFIDVASADDLPIGRIKAAFVDGRKIVLYHTVKGFFASDSVCPHRGGPLAEGDLIGNEIVCPWHLWGFDVETGSCPGNTDICIVTHEVRVEADRILIRPSPVIAEVL